MTVCPFCSEPVLDCELEARAAYKMLDGNLVHIECLCRQVAGSLGHQLGHCPCFGGSEEDPPGLTKRQAARAAFDHYQRTLMYRCN